MLFGCFFVGLLMVGAAAGPVLLVIGLIGQRDASRPRCRACRHPLVEHAALPPRCAGCGVELTSARAVGFGGWRLRKRALFGGIVLIALIGGFILVMRRGLSGQAPPAVQAAGTSTITEEELTKRTESLDDDSWSWVKEQLHAGTLSPRAERMAVELMLDAIARGDWNTERMVHFVEHAKQWTKPELAAAMLGGLSDPELEASSGRNGLVVTMLGPRPAVTGWSGPISLSVAVMEVRADGVPLPAARPMGRAGGLRQILESVYEDPDRLAAAAARIEIDLIWSAFDAPDTGFASGLPGPPETWPTPLAQRQRTVVITR